MRQLAAGVIVGVLGVALTCRAADAGAQALADYETVFGAEARRVGASTSLSEQAAFAGKLLEAAKRTSDSPALQVVLAEKACQFGQKAPAAYGTCMEALELLQAAAPERKVDWLSRRCQVLKTRAGVLRGDAGQAAAVEYLDALMVYAEEAGQARRCREAEEAYQSAIVMARRLESPRREEAQAGLGWVAGLAQTQQKAQAWKARVAANPGDAGARTKLVQFLLAEMDSPEEAAKALAPELDEALRTYVALACRKVEELPPAASLELGQWYARTLVKDATPTGQAIVLERARGYIQRFLDGQETHDVGWLKAKTALEEVEGKLARLPRRGKPVTASGPAMSLTRGLVLYLPMDRIERSFTPDAGPRGLHARALGFLKPTRGRVGGAGLFDGKNDHLSVNDNPALNPTAAISLAAWFKADGWDGNSRIIQKGSNDNQYRLLREDGPLKFHLVGVTGGTALCDAPAPGSWHHVAGVYDGQTIRIYLDGRQKSSKPASGRIAVSSEPFYVATKAAHAVGPDHFRGALDEIRLYNRALTPKEVEMLALTSGEKK